MKVGPRRVKRTTQEDLRCLNLGCGSRTHPEWTNVDFSPYARLRRRPRVVSALVRTGLLAGVRLERLRMLDPDIVCHDLRRGVPFPDRTFDVVYHSHLLEHLPRAAAERFTRECWRVCCPGGVLRIVVPNLERAVTAYMTALERLDEGDETAWTTYDEAVHATFEQMVRSQPLGMSAQPTARRLVERALRGGVDRTGERHLWMYDRHALTRLVKSAGFGDVRLESARTSRVAGWARFGLDDGEADGELHPGSLYLEAVRLP